MTLPDLPITEIIDPLMGALKTHRRAVVEAPPGAGKTTVIPLALLKESWLSGRILLLEPRRLAARAAAERMAATLGEKVGEQVGYRIRGDSKVGPQTRIEVVTEGILTRMVQADPGLEGIGIVIFDEFHERSLHADLGLALCHEVHGALRDDLALLVMSATLDAAPIAQMLGAPILRSEGRAFPVETHWLERPPAKSVRLEQAAADLILHALAETQGGLLAFLPGEGEIRRTEALLRDKLPPDTTLFPLYGALPFAEQRRAVEPLASGRKIVLATAIAETSLTIQDIRVVVDCGQARRAVFDPGTGMSRLITDRVTRAEAEQRRGRAGRVASGWCYRMWTKPAEGALAAFPEPEIVAGDLTGFTLELAQWGATAEGLSFLTPPAPGGIAAAQNLLQSLGALDDKNRITEHGRALTRVPLHPRLAHMLRRAGPSSAKLAALLSSPERVTSIDLSTLRERLSKAQLAEARRLAKMAGPEAGLSWGEAAALAYPDRVGLRRPGEAPRYLLSGGRGAEMPGESGLANARLIVATELDGRGREARIRHALSLSESELRTLFEGQIRQVETCQWDSRHRRVAPQRCEMFGALSLSQQNWKNAPAEAIARAALDGVRDLGLPITPAARLYMARVAHLRASGTDLPDLSEATLTARLEEWLLPHLNPPPKDAAAIAALDILPALKNCLSWDEQQMLDRLAPGKFHTPTGRDVPIDYSGEAPEAALRLQELFGTTSHPIVAGQPLRLTLLSPAGRPLQTTADLPGFWASSYNDVRKDMRGRYPKHPWPEDPTQAAPTMRAKPRGR